MQIPMERLDFRRTRSLYVNVRGALNYKALSHLKEDAGCVFSTLRHPVRET